MADAGAAVRSEATPGALRVWLMAIRIPTLTAAVVPVGLNSLASVRVMPQRAWASSWWWRAALRVMLRMPG